MPFRGILGLSAAVSGHLRRGLSTAAWHPPWAMIYRTALVKSPVPSSSIQLGVPPCASTLFVPDHLVDLRPRPAPDSDIVPIQTSLATATSGDGLLLLDFRDGSLTAPFVTTPDGRRERMLVGCDLDPDVTRLVCNPLSGQVFRLPDIDGTKKSASCRSVGLLTRSADGQGPPDRYAVAALSEDRDAEKRSFVMRRFLSQTGEWEKLVDLPSPLPLPRRMEIYPEVLAFAGRLWFVDLNWGAVSADPFSDRPELRFVELPSASVLPVPSSMTELAAAQQVEGLFRRMGVSEGRLRYVELSQKMPFLLSSFVLDEESNCWTLEHSHQKRGQWQRPSTRDHRPRPGNAGSFSSPPCKNVSQVAYHVPRPRSSSPSTRELCDYALENQVELARLCGDRADPPPDEHTPRIGVVHPLNANFMYITIGNRALALDMEMEMVLSEPIDEPGSVVHSTLLRPCVLPPWLKSSRIPCAGKKEGAGNKTLADVLVRSGRD